MDRQGGRRVDRALGGRVAALPGARVQGESAYGGIQGANLLDWPVTLQELEPYYAKAEDKMGVTRTNGIPGLPGNNNFKVLAAGATKVGYKMSIRAAWRSTRNRATAAAPANKSASASRDACRVPNGRRFTPRSPRVRQTGKLEVRPKVHAAQIEHDAGGKVTGVVYFDKDGKQQRQKARAVCVAGNSIETPRLLLLSQSSKFPNGLANSSGQLGRNYMRHMTGSVYAVFDRPVRMWRGTTMAGIVTDEAAHNPKRGFVGGYEMETLSIGLPFMAAFLDPGAWGREFTSALDGYENMAGMWLVGEDMPQENNRITLDPSAKDKRGLPVASVHFDDHPNDVAMRNHAYKAGTAIYEAVECHSGVSDAAISFHTQSRHVPDVRKSARRRLQQIRPKSRHQESVHLGR